MCWEYFIPRVCIYGESTNVLDMMTCQCRIATNFLSDQPLTNQTKVQVISMYYAILTMRFLNKMIIKAFGVD